MHSYHVYFNAKEGIPNERLIEQVHVFMRQQSVENHVKAYRLLNLINKASFQDMPDFHLVVDYESQEDLEKAFVTMKKTYRDDPHGSLMSIVSGFRVAFSIDK